jgi:hypothetical protein
MDRENLTNTKEFIFGRVGAAQTFGSPVQAGDGIARELSVKWRTPGDVVSAPI